MLRAVADSVKLAFVVPGDDFTRAGEASGAVKKTLKQLGIHPDVVRRVAIALYEGEINMVIHATGGTIDVEISPGQIEMTLTDHGPGIEDIGRAMQAGYSTAPEEVRNLGFGAGMGLPNMQKYTDTMRLESTLGVGTTVFMTVLNEVRTD